MKRGKKKQHRAAAPGSSDRLAAAIQRHQQGHPEEAATIYREILSGSADNADALHFLGVAEHQLGRPESALQHIDRAVALAPDYADALNNRGNILKELGRLDEAERDYRRAVVIRPNDASALSNLGTVYRAKGDPEGAVAVFRQVIAMRRDYAAAWHNLGNALGVLGRLDEALDAYTEAMRLAPRSADAHKHLGAALYAVGRLEESAEIYRRWLALFPDDPRAQHFAAANAQQPPPRRASDDYVRAEFDGYAANFDDSLARLEYQAPRLVDEEITRVLGAPRPTLTVLDAGCGTGLCGPLLRPRAARLTGVDLSPAMIELARRRALYDSLAVEELTAHLRSHRGTIDLIASADTLVYFGDLGEVTAAAANALRAEGVFVFTVERVADGDAPGGYHLNPHGRYSHTRDYLVRALGAAGFAAPSLREVHLRKEAQKWVEGWLVSARISPLRVAASEG
jgi:predicted TPR repeat methyltransferase